MQPTPGGIESLVHSLIFGGGSAGDLGWLFGVPTKSGKGVQNADLHGIATVANGAYLDIRPPSGELWVITAASKQPVTIDTSDAVGHTSTPDPSKNRWTQFLPSGYTHYLRILGTGIVEWYTGVKLKSGFDTGTISVSLASGATAQWRPAAGKIWVCVGMHLRTPSTFPGLTVTDGAVTISAGFSAERIHHDFRFVLSNGKYMTTTNNYSSAQTHSLHYIEAANTVFLDQSILQSIAAGATVQARPPAGERWVLRGVYESDPADTAARLSDGTSTSPEMPSEAGGVIAKTDVILHNGFWFELYNGDTAARASYAAILKM